MCLRGHRNSNKCHYARLIRVVCLKCQFIAVKQYRRKDKANEDMYRREMMFGLAAMGLAACDPAPNRPLGPDGLPLPSVYRIRPRDEAAVQFRMLDSVNAVRQQANVPQVQLDGRLNAAAATHSRDMSIQNRPWLFGSDGSSPLDRARRVGFPGRLLGENISESYETELQTLAAWMAQKDTRAVLVDPEARLMGFAWYQEDAGKLWWTLTMGGNATLSQPLAGAAS